MDKVNKLNKELYSEALNLGMCEKGINGWGKPQSLDDLCEMYWWGLEFVIDHHGWPSNKWMLDNVGSDTLRKHNIYVNDDMLINDPPRAILNGRCNIRIKSEGTPDIYVRDKSRCTIHLTDEAIAHITVYDDADLTVDCGAFSKCFIYQYGGTVNAGGTGKIIVRDRRGPK